MTVVNYNKITFPMYIGTFHNTCYPNVVPIFILLLLLYSRTLLSIINIFYYEVLTRHVVHVDYL